MHATPLTLTLHDPAWLDLHNRLHQPRQAWSATLGEQSIELSWGAAAPLNESTRDLWLTLGEAWLRLRISGNAVPTALPVASDDAEADALLMELALLAVLEPLEVRLGVPLRVRAERDFPATDLPLNLHLALSIDHGPAHSVQLEMDATAAALLADRLLPQARPLLDSFTALAVVLAVEAGQAWLSLADWRGLRPGDVVMLDTPAERMLVLNRTLQARAERHGEAAIRLLEPLNPVNPTLENPMNSPENPRAEDATLNDLPLKLVCQIGSLELSLAQLQQLGVGSLLQLTPRTDEAVDLMINGRCVGRGHLVQIGEGLGVRLQSFAKA